MTREAKLALCHLAMWVGALMFVGSMFCLIAMAVPYDLKHAPTRAAVHETIATLNAGRQLTEVKP